MINFKKLNYVLGRVLRNGDDPIRPVDVPLCFPEGQRLPKFLFEKVGVMLERQVVNGYAISFPSPPSQTKIRTMIKVDPLPETTPFLQLPGGLDDADVWPTEKGKG
jgi:hypothetical protein